MIPSALEHVQEIAGASGHVAVFLDYDGTLTPIVSQPENASLSDAMRETLNELAARVPLAILSGRDLNDVRRCVAIDSILYAGSHGFDIAGPGGLRRETATELLPELDVAEKELRAALDGISGARVQRKRFSIAAHYRNVSKNDLSKVHCAVSDVLERHPELRRLDGKQVCELLPGVDWDKGKAVLWLLETLRAKRKNLSPIYVGDDSTDEDAFRAIEQRGCGIVVSEQSQPTAAKFSLKNPAEVERFLRELAARLS
jgi:alpha,alpha-trehalase